MAIIAPRATRTVLKWVNRARHAVGLDPIRAMPDYIERRNQEEDCPIARALPTPLDGVPVDPSLLAALDWRPTKVGTCCWAHWTWGLRLPSEEMAKQVGQAWHRRAYCKVCRCRGARARRLRGHVCRLDTVRLPPVLEEYAHQFDDLLTWVNNLGRGTSPGRKRR